MKLIILTSLLITTAVHAEGFTWNCMKDEKIIKVTGNNIFEKKADCLKQHGTWEKKPLVDIMKQPSGSAGGW